MWLKIIEFQYVNSEEVVAVKFEGGIAVLMGRMGGSMFEMAKVTNNHAIATMTQKWFKLKSMHINPLRCSKLDFIPADGSQTVQFFVGGTSPAFSSSDPADVAAVRRQLP